MISSLGVSMRVQVKRASGMPHNVGLWIKQTPATTTVYVDAGDISDLGAAALGAAISSNPNWQDDPAVIRRLLRVHTG